MSTSKAGRLVRVGLYDFTPGDIGKGNFALVRLGVHRLTKTSVAVKIVDKTDLDDENLQKISREIEIMRHLDHPSIIRLFQVMETEGMIYIVTEFASKGDIFDHLVKHKRMSEPEACHVFAQILSAVKYCHTQGVVHRDLKAENLLLDGDSNIKLADFGFSNYYTDTCLLSTWCGSPPYAAPELFEGKRYVGPKADIWSLGVVLYVLVSGTLPFDGPTLMELRERVVKCQYRVPFFLSQECEALLRGLLVVEPEKRLGLDSIARHPWTLKMASPVSQPWLDQVINMTKPDKPMVNEATVDVIVKTVGVDRETVIDCVTQNKCDDVSAMYHMIELNKRELERERLFAAVTPSMIPPLSPTSLSPFFSTTTPSSSPTATSHPQEPRVVTEVFNSSGACLLPPDDEKDDRLLTARRHTLGPGQTPKSHPRGGPYPMPIGAPGGRGGIQILPQTNLTQNLPLVSNLPPEKFSVKNPHLLKPPPALLGHGSTGRRASDGGSAYFSSKEEAQALAGSSEGLVQIHHDDKSPVQQQPQQQQQQQQQPPVSPRISVPQADSPRKRRSGVGLVSDKPPEINPELAQEVEARIRAQASPTSPAVAVPQTATSPNKSASSAAGGSATGGSSSLRHRRTGLATVMEVKMLNPAEVASAADQRRLSDPFRCNAAEVSPSVPGCDAIVAMQEEARLYQNEGASSADSASSGYMSPHFLRPPSPSDDLHMQPRRSSDSGVGDMVQENSLRNSASAPSSKPIQQLYDEMYMDPSSPAVTLNNARRYSYPNSPVHTSLSLSPSHQLGCGGSGGGGSHGGGHHLHHHHHRKKYLNQEGVAVIQSQSTKPQPTPSHKSDSSQQQQQQQQPPPQVQVQQIPSVQVSITNHLQQLRLHQKIEEEECPPSVIVPENIRWKGSITQGVPSRQPASSPTATTNLRTPPVIGHSHSFDEAYETTIKPRGIVGSVSSIWQTNSMCSSDTMDTDVDYMSLPMPLSAFAASSAAAASMFSDPLNHPEICVTNVTGDEIKYVFGQTGSSSSPPPTGSAGSATNFGTAAGIDIFNYTFKNRCGNYYPNSASRLKETSTMDKEARDLQKCLQRTPKKESGRKNRTTELTPTKCKVNNNNDNRTMDGDGAAQQFDSKKYSQNSSDIHPVYHEISFMNGQINRMSFGEMKEKCKSLGLDCSGRREAVKRRLKEHLKVQRLVSAGLMEAKVNRNADYLVVVDFEATCEERNPPGYPHEIIEFPAVLVSTRDLKIEDVFHSYVRPVINPMLSDFCKNLTQIDQATVDGSDTFEVVHKKFLDWQKSHGLGITKSFIMVTDGPFDMGRFLFLQCKHIGMPYPESYGGYWANLRKIFANFYKEGFYANNNHHHYNRDNRDNQRLPGLQTMLTMLGLEFQGHPHSGVDDSKNIAQIVISLLKDQAVIRVNERIHYLEKGVDDTNRSGGRLLNVVPVAKKEAEHWFRTQKYNLETSKPSSSNHKEE